MSTHNPQPNQSLSFEESAGYDRSILNYIHNAAAHSFYEIRGLGAKKKLPHLKDGAYHSAIEDYAAIATAPGYCHPCHADKCPVGITTQIPYWSSV